MIIRRRSIGWSGARSGGSMPLPYAARPAASSWLRKLSEKGLDYFNLAQTAGLLAARRFINGKLNNYHWVCRPDFSLQRIEGAWLSAGAACPTVLEVDCGWRWAGTGVI